MIKSVQRQRNLQLWCSGHCPFASIITLLLIYDHDFHLPFPQYQQVVDGMESPSSHFRIGFLPDKLLHCSFHQSASLQNIQHIQHLVHGGSPFRNIKNMRCVRMFMTFWEQGWFSEFVWKPECGEKTENACLHLHQECSSLTVLYSEASFPWRQRGELTNPAALFSRRLSCELGVVRWSIVLAFLLPTGEKWQTVHTALYLNLSVPLCPPHIFIVDIFWFTAATLQRGNQAPWSKGTWSLVLIFKLGVDRSNVSCFCHYKLKFCRSCVLLPVCEPL